MPNLTEEKQAQVTEILTEAKGLYTAILLVKPPASLGLAIRDVKPWDELKEPEITALFSVIVQLRKAALASMAPAAAAPAEAPNPAPEIAPKGAPLAVEVVKKPTQKKGSETPETSP